MSGFDEIDLQEVEEARRRSAEEKALLFEEYAKKHFSGVEWRDSKMCQDCLSEYKGRYVEGEFITELPEEEHALREADGTLPEEVFFPITCDGDSRCGVGDILTAETDEDYVLSAMINPDIWFEEELGIELRTYQSDSASCSARLKVDRWGRRCLPETEMVRMWNDDTKSIKDIVVGDEVLSTIPTLLIPIKGLVTAVFRNGEKRVYKITLEDGSIIRCTSNHPIYIMSDGDTVFRSIDEGLHIGSNVVCIQDRENELYTYNAISSIEYIGIRETYDITVDDHHNFLVDNIVTHNTGKTHHKVGGLLQKMQHGKGTDKHGRIIPEHVLIVAPYQPQVDEIFNKIEEMLAGSKTLANSVARRTKSPNQLLTFTNGSRAIGFCTGANAGRGGDKIRGQGATLIYGDEADYMNDQDVESFIAILADNPDTALWMTSTPTGRHGKFWTFCLNKAGGFKERHVPGTMSPSWNPITERILREQYSKAGWDHEVMALFGEVEGGVFSTAMLQKGLHHYNLENTKKIDGAIHSIGVDWNGADIGVPIIVVAYYPDRNSYVMVDKYTSKSTHETQLTAVNDIIEMFNKWDADVLYVDEGYGCLSPDTIVYSSTGPKEIRDVKINDSLLDMNGVYSKVVVAENTGVKDSYQIDTLTALPLIASKNHLHIVARCSGYKEPSDADVVELRTTELRARDDEMGVADYMVIVKEKIDKPDSMFVDLIDYSYGGYNVDYDDVGIRTIHSNLAQFKEYYKQLEAAGFDSSLLKSRRKTYHARNWDIPDKDQEYIDGADKILGNRWRVPYSKRTIRLIDLCDDKLLLVMGWCLASNSRYIGGFKIYSSGINMETFFKVSEISSVMWNIHVVKKDESFTIFIQNIFIANLMDKMLSLEDEEPSIHPDVMRLNPVVLVRSLAHYSAEREKNTYSFTVPGRLIASQVKQILVNNDILSSVSLSKGVYTILIRIDYRNFKSVNAIFGTKYTSRKSDPLFMYKETDTRFYVPIEKIDHIGEVDNMFDLTMAGDPSFCANGMITHNSTQIELIKSKAKQLGNDKLAQAIRGIPMQGKQDIRDPITKKKIKKQHKALMTDLAVIRVENGLCFWPKAENDKDELVDQLRNYKIDRYTQSGLPVYSQGVDHQLVSWILAIYGIVIEFSDLARIDGKTSLGMIPLEQSSDQLIKSDKSNDPGNVYEIFRKNKEQTKPSEKRLVKNNERGFGLFARSGSRFKTGKNSLRGARGF